MIPYQAGVEREVYLIIQVRGRFSIFESLEMVLIDRL